MILKIIIGIAMVGCFVGMIICLKKQNANPIAKPLAIILLLVIAVCSILMLTSNQSSSHYKPIMAHEHKFARASTYVLGKKLAETMPGAKVLLIVDDYKDERAKMRETLIEGLKEGFGSDITSVIIKAPHVTQPKKTPIRRPIPTLAEIEKLKPEDFNKQAEKLPDENYEENTDENNFYLIEEIMTSEDFNRLIKQNNSCNLIISLIGLPKDIEGLDIWRDFQKDPMRTPKLVIGKGEVSKMYPAIKSGIVPAVVAYKLNFRFQDLPPEDLQEAFDVRYLLITTENVDEIAKKYGEEIFLKAGR